MLYWKFIRQLSHYNYSPRIGETSIQHSFPRQELPPKENQDQMYMSVNLKSWEALNLGFATGWPM